MRFRSLILLLCVCALAFVVTACAPTPTAAPPDTLELVTQAAENIRQTETFRMLVEQTGAPYYIETDLGSVQFRRAIAQYVAPRTMQASVRLLAAGLPAEVDVFSKGANQWYRNSILTANRWFNAPFSPGFNPETLIAQETGFQAALQALIDLVYIGQETLEDGSLVHHLKATANGPDVTALMAGLVYMTGTVNVDVYIHVEQIIPSRFIIVQPETGTEEEPEPTTWTMDIYDLNADAELDDPEADPNTIGAPPTVQPLIDPFGAMGTPAADATADPGTAAETTPALSPAATTAEVTDPS